MQSKRFRVDSPVGSDSSNRRTKAEWASTDHSGFLVTAVTSAWRADAQYPASPYPATGAWGSTEWVGSGAARRTRRAADDRRAGRGRLRSRPASTGVRGTTPDLLRVTLREVSDRRL